MGAQFRRWQSLFMIEGLVVLVVLAGIVAFNPRSANSFGYALPGADGLPWRIHVGGRDYSNPGTCAGADWCKGQERTCWPQSRLESEDLWPLTQVSSIFGLFSQSYPIFSPPIPVGMTTTLLFVPVGSCFVVYALEGGP